MYTDPISDFLTRIRNAYAAGLDTMNVPASRIKYSIAKVLEREGFIAGVKESSDGPKKSLMVTLKYDGKVPAIRSIDRISTPGRRVYSKTTELRPVLSGQGIAILSTSSGLMTNREARRRKLGGEVLCEVT